MKVKNGFVIREICGEKVLSGEGSDFTEESLVSLLCGKYDVSPEVALSDVKAMCSRLKENGVLE